MILDSCCQLQFDFNCACVNIYWLNGQSSNVNVCFDQWHTERGRRCAFTLHCGVVIMWVKEISIYMQTRGSHFSFQMSQHVAAYHEPLSDRKHAGVGRMWHLGWPQCASGPWTHSLNISHTSAVPQAQNNHTVNTSLLVVNEKGTTSLLYCLHRHLMEGGSNRTNVKGKIYGEEICTIMLFFVSTV